MHTYWKWLLLLAVSWVMASVHDDFGALELAGSALFFGLFFLMPLLAKKPLQAVLTLSFASVIALAVFWPEAGAEPNPYPLLIFSILAGKAVYRLPPKYAITIGALLFIGTGVPAVQGDSVFPPIFLALYASLLAAVFTLYKRQQMKTEADEQRTEALLVEYRKMKRRIRTDEQAARQQERTQIARDIHDSVGHKLTALLMQLEMFRMQAEGETAEQLKQLKALTKESLEETRSAVKTLKQDEEGGVAAIISLIRQLEAESFLRIQFSVKSGALSAQLGNQELIIVYRMVQEALTNVMRHSKVKEAEIIFESPGGTVFRFTVRNPLREPIEFCEGFGLGAMRERIEQAGGRFEAGPRGKEFVVEGTLPLPVKRGEQDDPDFTGGRSGDGPARIEDDD